MSISFFKNLTQADRTTSRTLLHENIPITGTLVSGTYEEVPSTGREVNIKTFSHGMFQSVYDYPYQSSSANHIFDIAVGVSTSTGSLSGSTPGITSQLSKKVNIYNQMAQVLAGFDTGSVVRHFDADGDLSDESSNTKHHDAIFLNFSRLLVKDEIKKGSFSAVLGTNANYEDPFDSEVTITDAAAANSYFINSPAGEYGILKKSSDNSNVGLIYYQAGVAILTSSVFGTASMDKGMPASGTPVPRSMESLMTGSVIDDSADAIRHRIKNIQFNNTTELNSTIYFCRANHYEFNYSANPTYLSESKIRVKEIPGTSEKFNLPRSYITTVGLYSQDNQLLAVAKLSEPLRKDPTNELTLRVRLDY